MPLDYFEQNKKNAEEYQKVHRSKASKVQTGSIMSPPPVKPAKQEKDNAQ